MNNLFESFTDFKDAKNTNNDYKKGSLINTFKTEKGLKYIVILDLFLLRDALLSA